MISFSRLLILALNRFVSLALGTDSDCQSLFYVKIGSRVRKFKEVSKEIPCNTKETPLF